MDDLVPISEAATDAGINRDTIARWIAKGKLKKRGSKQVRNLRATLVSRSDVQAIVAQGVRRGRPKKEK